MLGALAGAGLGLAACSSATRPGTKGSSGPGGSSPVGSDQYTRYAGSGPYAAGTYLFRLHGDTVVTWYPASPASVKGRHKASYRLRSWLPAAIATLVPASFPDVVSEDAYTGVPLAPGRFPVVMFSHGYGGYPEQSSFLMTRLAQWGFIVVAPDQTATDLRSVTLGKATKDIAPPRSLRQQSAALEAVISAGSKAGSPFGGHVLDEVGVVGHSAGGDTAVEMAVSDRLVRVVVTMSGVPVAKLPTRPLTILLMGSPGDKVVPMSRVSRFYGRLHGSKALLTIDDVGHNAFDDVCTVAHSRGGVVAAARSLHLPVPKALLSLATDGCFAPDIYPPKVWPLVVQATVAELRYGFGFDPTPSGLGTGLDDAFTSAGVTATYRSSGM